MVYRFCWRKRAENLPSLPISEYSLLANIFCLCEEEVFSFANCCKRFCWWGGRGCIRYDGGLSRPLLIRYFATTSTNTLYLGALPNGTENDQSSLTGIREAGRRRDMIVLPERKSLVQRGRRVIDSSRSWKLIYKLCLPMPSMSCLLIPFANIPRPPTGSCSWRGSLGI